eukprot:1161016-Pelagomonas_calceolata.AAC.1
MVIFNDPDEISKCLAVFFAGFFTTNDEHSIMGVRSVIRCAAKGAHCAHFALAEQFQCGCESSWHASYFEGCPICDDMYFFFV